MTRHGGDIYRIAGEYGFKPGDILDFSSNINLLGPPASLKNIMAENFDLVKNYPDPDYRRLKECLGGFNNTDPRNIIPGNGATELIYLIPRALAPKDALIIAPAFSEYGKALKQAGARISHFRIREEDDFSVNLAGLLKEIRKGYRFIVLCNPNNPTGNFTNRDMMEAVIGAARKHDSMVMVDESFIEFMNGWEDQTSAALAKRYTNVIILRSMTKFFAIPGIRLGYIICHNRPIKLRINSFKEPWSVNIVADLSARMVLEDTAYMKKSCRVLDEEKTNLCRELDTISGIRVFHPAANFILMKLPGSISSRDLREKLMGHKILIRDASNFKFLDSRFVRIAIRGRKDNMALVKAMKNYLA